MRISKGRKRECREGSGFMLVISWACIMLGVRRGVCRWVCVAVCVRSSVDAFRESALLAKTVDAADACECMCKDDGWMVATGRSVRASRYGLQDSRGVS